MKADRFRGWPAEDGCPAGPEIANRFCAGRSSSFPGSRGKGISASVMGDISHQRLEGPPRYFPQGPEASIRDPGISISGLIRDPGISISGLDGPAPEKVCPIRPHTFGPQVDSPLEAEQVSSCRVRQEGDSKRTRGRVE